MQPWQQLVPAGSAVGNGTRGQARTSLSSDSTTAAPSILTPICCYKLSEVWVSKPIAHVLHVPNTLRHDDLPCRRCVCCFSAMGVINASCMPLVCLCRRPHGTSQLIWHGDEYLLGCRDSVS